MNIAKHQHMSLVVFLILAGSTCPGFAQTGVELDVSWDIEQLLRTEDLSIDGVRILTQGILLEVYERNGFSPIWTDRGRLREVTELISGSADHGLVPTDYNLDKVRQIVQQWESPSSAEMQAEADILLTESIVRYGYHRRFGKVEGSKLDPNINFRRETFRQQGAAVTLEQAIHSPSLTDFIDLVAPTGPIYRQLQDELRLYRDIAAAGGWSSVPDGPTVRLDDDDPRIGAIRTRLVLTGDLPSDADTDSQVFDQELKDAVAVFQERHSLDDDGVVGAQTLAAMNIPVETRVDQLRLSLERLRWVDHEALDTFVAVNIAGFRAFFFEDGELEWVTREMVGTEYRATPVFRGDIAYLEFNPTWTIPPGILRNDTLPAIKRDPNYLASRNIRVIDSSGDYVDPSTVDWNQYSRGVPYTLRQDPGPTNAMGIVKFIFPNEHFVFLHDTPNRSLFSQPERAFSSGCIRVENPLTLAELVLDDPENYSETELEAIVESRETKRIRPTSNVPVLIVYLTASIDPSGQVRFYKDVYGRDQRILDALNGDVTINDSPDRVAADN